MVTSMQEQGHSRGSGPRGRGSGNRRPGPARSSREQFSSGDGHRAAPGSLEGRLYRWLDILVWVWRRRTDPSRPFAADARLTDGELHALAAGVRTLSRGLTGERDLKAAPYMEDPGLLGAYLLFYWPISWAQAWTVLHDPGLALQGFRLPRRALDAGSGPGPLAFALLDAGVQEVLALDASPAALDLARDIHKACREAPGGLRDSRYGSLETRVWKAGESSGGDGRFGLVTLGHVLNELPDTASRLETLDALSGNLESGGTFLVVEPALRQTSRDLLSLRDSLIARRGARMQGPCFFRGPCPALAEADQTCHHTVRWQVPGMIQRLAHAARLGKEEISMAWLAWTNHTAPDAGGPGPAPVRGEGTDAPGGRAGGRDFSPDSTLYRVCGDPLLNKAGFTRIMVCGGHGAGTGREGRMTLRMRREDMAAGGGLRAAGRVFFSLGRGDTLRLESPALRETGLGAGEETRMERMGELHSLPIYADKMEGPS